MTYENVITALLVSPLTSRAMVGHDGGTWSFGAETVESKRCILYHSQTNEIMNSNYVIGREVLG